jgi:hypothetical protein
MKTYNFDVTFTVVIKAKSYEKAVRKADRLLPDVDGKTTFVVNTEEYGFFPSQETMDNMHGWKECSCHAERPTIEELNTILDNNLAQEIEDNLKIEDSVNCIVCGTNDLTNHDLHCTVPNGKKYKDKE